MSFIETVAESAASGTLKELYEDAAANAGYIPNYLRLFSHRPEVYQAWEQLGSSIRRNMTLRRYELATLAAARALEGSYCMLAHGDALLNSGEVDATQLAAIATDYEQARLEPDEVAMMAFAEKIIVRSSSITQADVDNLRRFGITDAEILDITLAATARSFFSKTLDALSAVPDAKYLAMDPVLRDVLMVGRVFDAVEQP